MEEVPIGNVNIVDEIVQERVSPREHRIAIRNFDGSTTIHEADELRMCVPTRACVIFWAETIAAFLCMIVGIIFLAVFPSSNVEFHIGEALLALGVGVLIPSPDAQSMRPKKAPDPLSAPKLK